MSSERQIAANRRNSQFSTGPRTANGKARTASNATTHGLTGNQIVLPNENPVDFDAFRTSLLDDLNPNGGLEQALAEKIIADLWRLRRVPLLEANLHRTSYESRPLDDAPTATTWSLRNCSQTFANLWRYEVALSRSWSKTLHELQRLQAMRAGEQVPVPAAVDVDLTINGNGTVNPE